MSTQHTPAPWTTDGDAYSGNLDIIALTGRIAMLDCEFSEETEDVLTANARLIAAAPDLLHALRDAVEILEGTGLDASIQRAAIAKATGGGQ